LVVFGSVHPEWSPDELIAQLGTLGKRIQLSHIGRIGPGESIWKDISSRYGSEIEIRLLGEQPADHISRFFASVDFGISTNPLALNGKSTCVAAMLEHGLPVIVTRNDVHFSGIPEVDLSSERLIPLDEHFLERVRSLRRGDPRGRLTEVTAQFLGDIGA
jgi:hypothetical protein